MAIVLPIVRFLDEKIMNVFAKRAAGSDNLYSLANVSITINVHFSMFIAIVIGSLATPLTSYCILGVDFMLNMVSCINIIRIHRKIGQQNAKSENLEAQKRNELTFLALTEIVEVLVPILYLSSFLIAYHGPNAFILGGIKNSYWNFDAVEDLITVVQGVGLMFLFDVIFGIVSCAILWRFAKVDMVREYCIALKKFWPMITLRLANNAAKVLLLEFLIQFQQE